MDSITDSAGDYGSEDAKRLAERKRGPVQWTGFVRWVLVPNLDATRGVYYSFLWLPEEHPTYATQAYAMRFTQTDGKSSRLKYAEGEAGMRCPADP